ncbi:MAG: RidA family protein [Candidatus Cloacimonetes bacterium]|nr:RidA family protein [Candidatus Cloacimonadota bacterium]
MIVKTIATDKAPAAIGPYSQGKIVNGMLYLSGQIPVNPKDGMISGETIEMQTKTVLDNIEILLKEAGCSFSNVIKTTCFLADMGDFAAFNKLYGEKFISKPARSCVAVRTLPKGVLVEIEVLAALD